MLDLPRPDRAYVICATPCSGHDLLGRLLRATGVAGRPAEHFAARPATGRPRQPREYFEGLDAPEVTGVLAPTEPGTRQSPAAFAALLRRALDRATTPNGVFATTVVWSDLGDLAERLQGIEGLAGRGTVDAIAALLPRVRWLHVTRRDRIAQAVALWTALQDGAAPEYRFRAIDHLAAQLEAQDHAWRGWFTANDILPLRVDHEELTTDPAQVVLDVLAELGIPDPPAAAALRPRMRRGDGPRSRAWVVRYLGDRDPARVDAATQDVVGAVERRARRRR